MSILKNDEHVFVAGMTGSGKTYLLKTYLAGNEKPVFVLDTKGTFTWEQVPAKLQIMCRRLEQIPNAAARYKYIIYRPDPEELDPEYYDAFFDFCYRMKNCTVAIDECMQICESALKMPPALKSIYTRGRELNVNAWTATQRPANIPVLTYSEATHKFIFKLSAIQDKKRLYEETGYEQFLKNIPKYYFWYLDGTTGDAPLLGTLTTKDR